MKRFSFSLQRLLDFREFREKDAEIALGRAVSAREEISLELESVAKKRVAAAYERGGDSPINDLLAIDRFVARLDARKDALLEDLAAAELAVERAREAYLEATRNRRVITKLRERRAGEWRKEYLEEEAANLDDLSGSRPFLGS